jgi:hypothetical protein
MSPWRFWKMSFESASMYRLMYFSHSGPVYPDGAVVLKVRLPAVAPFSISVNTIWFHSSAISRASEETSSPCASRPW